MTKRTTFMLRWILLLGLGSIANTALACFNASGQPVSCSSPSCDVGLSAAGGGVCIVSTPPAAPTPPVNDDVFGPTVVPEPADNGLVDISDDVPGPGTLPESNLPDVFEPDENADIPDILEFDGSAQENFVLKHWVQELREIRQASVPIGERVIEATESSLPFWMKELATWTAPFGPEHLSEFEEQFQREWRLHELRKQEWEWRDHIEKRAERLKKRRQEALEKLRASLPEDQRQLSERELAAIYDGKSYVSDSDYERYARLNGGTPVLDAKLFGADPMLEKLTEIQDAQKKAGPLNEADKKEKAELTEKMKETDIRIRFGNEGEYRRYAAIRWSEEEHNNKEHHSIRNEVQGIIALD